MTCRTLASIGLVLACWSGAADAHQLPGSTATVALRDGLVTVEGHLDIAAWMRAQTASHLPEMVASAKAQAAALTVRLDGEPVPMTLERFPSVDRIHAVLQRPAGDGEAHHPKVVRVQWRAVRAMPGASSVTVRLPEAVGHVLVSFVEPRSRLATPGGTARFERWRPQRRRADQKEER